MSDRKRRNLCTIDHSGKQLETRRDDAQGFWLELARRRRAEREHRQAAARPKEWRRDA